MFNFGKSDKNSKYFGKKKKDTAKANPKASKPKKMSKEDAKKQLARDKRVWKRVSKKVRGS